MENELLENMKAGVKEITFEQYGVENSAFVPEDRVERFIEKMQEKGCKIVDVEER